MKFVVRIEWWGAYEPTITEQTEYATYEEAKAFYDACDYKLGKWDSIELLTIHESRNGE